MVDITRAYKSGTVERAPTAGSSELRVNPNTGSAAAASDVGRILKITSGAARNQWREITGVATGTPATYTLSHPFDTTNIPGFTDVLPTTGATYTLGWWLQDLQTAFRTADLANISPDTTRIQGKFHVSNNALVVAHRRVITFSAANIEIDHSGGFIIGNYGHVPGELAYAKDLCVVVDTDPNRGGNSLRPSTNVFGQMECWGSQIIATGGGFWRCYDESPTASSPNFNCVRLVDVRIQGNFAGRGSGNRSFVDISEVSSASDIGPFNPIDNIPYKVIALDCLQAGYIWLQRAKDSDSTVIRAADLSSRVFRVDAGGGRTAASGSNNGIHIMRAKFNEIRNIDPFIFIQRLSSTDNASRAIFRYANTISPSFINEDTTPVMGGIAVSIFDRVDRATPKHSMTIDVGNKLPAFDARHTDMTVDQTNVATQSDQNINLSDGTKFAPYDLFAIAWGKRVLYQRITAEEEFSPELTLLFNPKITETDRTVVRAYTVMDSPQKIYDHIVEKLVRQFEARSFHLLRQIGMGETLPLLDITENTLNFLDNDIYFVRDHNETEQYQIGDLVVVNGSFYSSRVVQSGGFVPAEWQGISSASGFPVRDVILERGTANERLLYYIYIGNEPLTANIITTGTVTNKNLRYINGGIIDSVADSALVFEGIDEWRVWNSHEDQLACMTEVARGGVQDNYRFNFTMGQTFALELRIGQSFVLERVMVLKSGITNVNLSTSAVLSSIVEQINSIQTGVENFPTVNLTPLTQKLDRVISHVADLTEEVSFDPARDPNTANAIGVDPFGNDAFGNVTGGDYQINAFSRNFTISKILLVHVPNSTTAIEIFSPQFVENFGGLNNIRASIFAGSTITIIVENTASGFGVEIAREVVQFNTGTVDFINNRISWNVGTDISNIPTINRKVRVIFENPNRETLQELATQILEDVNDIQNRTPDRKLVVDSEGGGRLAKNDAADLHTI